MSREYSDEKLAGSLKRNEDFNSLSKGLLGVAQSELGKWTTWEDCSKNCL